MEILILYNPNCPSKKILPTLVKQALEELNITCEFSEKIIENLEEAQQFRFYGSPSIKVNGKDLEPGADESKNLGLG